MTNINEDDYQDDWNDWGDRDDQDHRHCNGDFVTRMTRVGGIRWMNDSMTGIRKMIGMTGIPGD